MMQDVALESSVYCSIKAGLWYLKTIPSGILIADTVMMEAAREVACIRAQ